MKQSIRISIGKQLTQTRGDLMEALKQHCALEIQTRLMLEQLEAQLRYFKIDLESPLAERMKESITTGKMTARLKQIDQKLILMAKDHSVLFDTVVDFNKLVLSMSEQHHKHFICFDAETTKVFADQAERFGLIVRTPDRRRVTDRRWIQL